MPFIEQDSAQGTTWPGTLCPECGLCCSGVLFADVRLERGDEPLALQSAGLVLRRARGHTAFRQPCSCHDGRFCRIYPERPNRCRDFDCYTLTRLERGTLDYGQALQRVREALHRADRVRHLLRDLGQIDDSIALVPRFRQLMKRPINLSDCGDSADQRGELMLAVGDLMDYLHREFLPQEQPAPGPSEKDQ